MDRERERERSRHRQIGRYTKRELEKKRKGGTTKKEEIIQELLFKNLMCFYLRFLSLATLFI